MTFHFKLCPPPSIVLTAQSVALPSIQPSECLFS